MREVMEIICEIIVSIYFPYGLVFHWVLSLFEG